MTSARWTPEQYQAYLDKGGKVPRFKELDTPATLTKKIKITLRPKKAKIDMLAELLLQLKITGIPAPTFTEYMFHGDRLWRSDLAWPRAMLLVEYEGGIFTGGAHTRGKHYESDCEKYNEAAILGYRVLRFTYDMVRTGLALSMIERALELAALNASTADQRGALLKVIKTRARRDGCVICHRRWNNHKENCPWPQLANE